MATRRSTNSPPAGLPEKPIEKAATVAERVEQSLPQLDINLVSDDQGAGRTPETQQDALHDAYEATAGRPRKQYRRRGEKLPIDLDPDFMQSPEKMNYALLLALLLRAGGSVKLTQAELERAGTEQNILFALSADETALEVSVVSTQSGIIRSPEAKWAQPSQNQLPNYTAPPTPAQMLAVGDALAELAALNGSPLPPAQRSEQPQQPQQQLRVVEMPQQSPPKSGDLQPQTVTAKAPGYVFPFETGSSPLTAAPGNLESLQSELMKDRTVAMQEQRAVERAEQGG